MPSCVRYIVAVKRSHDESWIAACLPYAWSSHSVAGRVREGEGRLIAEIRRGKVEARQPVGKELGNGHRGLAAAACVDMAKVANRTRRGYRQGDFKVHGEGLGIESGHTRMRTY